jgi:O-antigen/teichoic acid export membrane protein
MLLNRERSRMEGQAGALTVLTIEDLQAGLRQYWQSALSSDFIGKVAETYLTRILLMCLALVTTVVVARLLGPEGRGYYAVAAATAALGVQFGNLGLHTSNTYFVAKQPDSLPFLTGNTLAVSFGFGGLIVLILGVIFTFAPGLLGIKGPTLLLALAWIPFGLAYTLMQNLMLGLQDVRGYNLAEIVSKTVPLLLIGILVLARHVSVASLFSTTLIALIASWLWVARRLQDRFPRRPEVSPIVFRNSIRYAVKAYLAATFCFLVLRVDLLMVQHMLGPEQAGYYSIASTMADYAAVLAMVIGAILFPKLSAVPDLRMKLALTRKATIGTALILLPLLGVASLSARPAVQLLFGLAFLPASLSFVLLMPGMFFLGIHTVAVQFLNSIGYPKSVVIIWGLCSLFNITVNLWAIPHHGIAGASVVSSISYFLAFFFVMWVIYRTGRGLEEGECLMQP